MTTLKLCDIIVDPLDQSSVVPRILRSISFIGSTSEQNIVLDIQAKSIRSTHKVESISVSPPSETEKSCTILKIPFIYDRILLKFVRSINLGLLKCSLTSKKATSSFSVSASEIKLPMNNNYSEFIVLTIFYDKETSFELKFYREPLSIFPTPHLSNKVESSTTVNQTITKTSDASEKQLSLTKKTLALSKENPFPIPMSDGPLFREALNSYEQLTPYIFKQLHSTLGNMNSLDQSSKSQLLGSLRDFRKEYLSALSKNDVVYSRFDFLRSNSSSNEDLIHTLINALHHSTSDVKIDFTSSRLLQSFNSNKKYFEDESKKYYDWLSKLMSSGKSKNEKLLLKTKAFVVAQIEYFNFLYDSVTPILLTLVQPDSLLNKNYWKNRPRRNQAVYKIKNCTSLGELFTLMQIYSQIISTKNSLLLMDKNSPYTFGKFDGPLKTGLLFVLGGQGKSGWHKQWVVLCDGKLYEFMDWRKGAELRNPPMDISLCNIKLLDGHDNKNIDIGSRKNCFRIITAQGVEHVFQTPTPEETNEWVKALFEAGQMIAFHRQNSKKEINERMGEKISSHAFVSEESNNTNVKRVTEQNNILQEETTRTRRVSSVSLSLLHVVQNHDPSNEICADCGSKEQVEWISMNILVVFCIKCSSAHRSLGTSVSKVRSLMLDSFTGENRALIYHINNSKANLFYEANLVPNQKPTPESSYETRLDFITKKYMKKMFVTNNVKNNAQQTLFEGIKDDDISKVLEGIAGGANLNEKILYTINGPSISIARNASDFHTTKQQIKQMSYLEYALLHPSNIDGREVFDLAELLALNGCDAGTGIRNGSQIDTKAKLWWQERIDKMNGGVTSLTNKGNEFPTRQSDTQMGTIYQKPIKPSEYVSNSRKSMSGSRPSLSISGSYKKSGTQSKPKIKSPKEGFNLFKKKIRSLE